MATGDLTTVQNLKAWMNLPATVSNDDPTLTRLVSAASQFVLTYLRRQIAVASYTDVRNGNDQYEMVLHNWPVTSVSSVTIYGTVIPPAPAMVANQPPTIGYLYDDQTVYLYGRCFDRGVQNVQIAYSAGYASTPLEIEQAVIELIALKYSDRNHFGQASKSINGEVVSFITADMPRGVATILQSYKKVVAVS